MAAADLDSLFESAGKQVEAGQKAFEQRLATQQADDRSHLAKLIVWAFVLLVGGVAAVIAVGTYLFNWQYISESAKTLVGLISSVMLPVVTLVIGYYFGNK
jgi:hypothetical protein